MRRSSRILTLMVLIALLAACGHQHDTPAPSTPRAATSYSDDFSNSSSGWPTENTDGHLTGYGSYLGQHAYVIRTESSYVSAMVTSPISHSLPKNIRIETHVSVSSQSSSGRGEAGVGCDYDNSGYLLMLKPGETYSLIHVENGGFAATVAHGSAAAMTVLVGLNTLQIACDTTFNGIVVTATINGVQVATYQDQLSVLAAHHVQVWLRGVSDSGESDAAFTSVDVFEKY